MTTVETTLSNSDRFIRGVVPEIHLTTSDCLPPADVLIVPVMSGVSGPSVPVASVLGERAQVNLWKTVVLAGVTGRPGEVEMLPADDNIPAARILAVGLGAEEALTADSVRTAAGNASRFLDRVDRMNRVNSADPVDDPAVTVVSLLGHLGDGVGSLDVDVVLSAAVEGHGLGGYHYPGQRRADPHGHRSTAVTVKAPDLPGVPAAFTRACVVVEAVTCARDLVNTPALDLFPGSYAEIIADLGERSGVAVEVLDEDALTAAGYGGLTGVGRGSRRPPRLVRMHYVPEDAARPRPHVALVGKGVTFDTGGISLKKPGGMDAMISDMAGSAAVVSAVLAAAELDLPVEVTATLPLVENMPDGDALRPGDVLRHYDGTTSEVANTDAEGRLILGDALARAVEDRPDLIIDAATLTGAQVASLGDRITAVTGTPMLRDRIVALAGVVGEDAWAIPLPDDVAAEISSDIADLRNTGTSGWGGMAAAGHYLAHFVPADIPWAHLDVAGPAYLTGRPHGYTPKRGTGVPVRTLIALLEDVTVSG